MITRAGDLSNFDNSQMRKIAEAVDRAESKKLYDRYDDVDLARIAAQELRVQGFQAETFEVGGKWEVYAVIPQKISLAEAEKSGGFKKLAFGHYVFQKESSLEMHSYPFDEGSIWRVVTDQDGNQILVKEVNDSDEEEVKRVASAAGLAKVAATTPKTFSFADSDNYDQLVHVLFTDNEDMIAAMMKNEKTKGTIDQFLNDAMSEAVKQKAAEYGISNANQLQTLNELVKSSLGTQVKCPQTFDAFVKEFAASEIEQNQAQHNIIK